MTQVPYTIIDTESGTVVQTGFAPENQLETMRLGLEDGLELRERDANPAEHRVSKGGSIIRKSKVIKEREAIEAARRDMRQKRRALLEQSDWTQMPDAPVDQAAWRAYRQALRDLPATTTDPRNVEWPEAPE